MRSPHQQNQRLWRTYAYDPLNCVTRMQQSGSGVTNKRVDYRYNPVGQTTNIQRFSDLARMQLVAETNHTFDRLNRLTNINHSRGGTPLSAYDYTYDANSRITGVTNKDGTAAYTYDDTDQLTGVDYSFQSDETYTYDANGNRTNPGYVTGKNNRLLSDRKFNYEYDGEGNLVRPQPLFPPFLRTNSNQEDAFDIAPRVLEQLEDSRMGRLQGRISPDDLQSLVNNPNATRLLDTRTGNINIIQEIDGKLVRITVPRDAKKIISVGPIQARNVQNSINRGDFIPLP